MYELIVFNIIWIYLIYYIVDSVTSTIQTSVDTTKNVAATAVDKGSSLIGTARGRSLIHNQVTAS